MSSDPAVAVHGVHKSFGATHVLRGIDLEVPAGTVVAITGSSGSGKTTLLRVVEGEETPDAGSVVVAKPVASVPQGGGLLAARTVSAIIALALPRKIRNSRAGAARVAEVFDLVGLADAVAGRRPEQLATSERQRVALARALVVRPTVVLLDEPFYAFDAATRARFRTELGTMLRRAGTASVLVSHHAGDVTELADRHFRLENGRLTLG